MSLVEFEEEEPMNRIQITKCEAEVMEIVWDKGCVTVNDVVDGVDRDLAYTTIMTTMKILEEKNIVRRGDKIGRAFTYRPAVTREAVRQGMVRELADRLFGGSVRSLALSLIDSSEVNADDIAALKEAANKLEEL